MNEEKIVAKLVDAGAPIAVAEAKATDSAIGWVLLLIGTIAFGVSGLVFVILARSAAGGGRWGSRRLNGLKGC
jgi:hypothetical protein